MTLRVLVPPWARRTLAVTGSSGGPDREAVLVAALDAAAQVAAGTLEPACDPVRVRAGRRAREGVLEPQPDELELILSPLRLPEREQAEVVATHGVHAVIVEGVAEVEEERPARGDRHAVEEVRGVAGDEVRAGGLQLRRRATLPAGGLGGHVRAPVREGDDPVAALAGGRDHGHQPVR